MMHCTIGRDKTFENIRKRYYWSGFYSDVQDWYEEELNLSIHSNKIEQEPNNQIKFLGIRFDKYFSLKHQIKYIKDSTNERMNILKVLSHKSWGLNTEVLLGIYKTLVRSLLDYSLFLFGVLSDNMKSKLQTIQNLALRIIYKTRYDYSSELLHSRAKLQRIEDRARFLNLRYINSAIINENELLREVWNDYEEIKGILKENRRQTLLDLLSYAT